MVHRALLCCFLVLLAACSATPAATAPGATATGTVVVPLVESSAALVASAAAEREGARVVRVIDGDTIDVRLGDGRTERVRYIGVDTPETVDPRTVVECFGAEASAR